MEGLAVTARGRSFTTTHPRRRRKISRAQKHYASQFTQAVKPTPVSQDSNTLDGLAFRLRCWILVVAWTLFERPRFQDGPSFWPLLSMWTTDNGVAVRGHGKRVSKDADTRTSSQWLLSSWLLPDKAMAFHLRPTKGHQQARSGRTDNAVEYHEMLVEGHQRNETNRRLCSHRTV